MGGIAQVRRESSIEKAFARICTQLFDAYGLPHKYVKTVTPGRKGWPDRLLVFGPNGHHIYIEWKVPGEEPDAMQQEIHRELQALGAEVRWYDNHYIALVEIEAFVRAKTGANPWDEANRPEWWDQIVLKARKGEDVNSPKSLRSPKAIRHGGRTPSARPPASNNDKLAVRDKQVGRLQASFLHNDSWGEDGETERDETGLGHILNEYRGLADD